MTQKKPKIGIKMLDWSTLSFLLGTLLVIVFLPGPNTLYIISRSIEQGPGAGIISSLGVQVGTLVYTTATAVGLSALLLSSVLFFNILKYAGAIYLIYLGSKTLITKETIKTTYSKQKASLSRIFSQGVVVNLLNPKTAFFFFAFLPQFVEPSHGKVAVQIILMGGIFLVLGLFSDTTYALLSGRLGNWLKQKTWFYQVQRYASGSVYIGLAVWAALSGF